MVAEIGLISMLDDAVGRILAAVDTAGLTDDTAVIFTADHGDLLGDHGLAQKGFVHYDGVTRVPLVVAREGLKPQRSNALVSNADLAPTILDMAGLEHYRGIQGRSLHAVLDGTTREHRDAVLIEEDQPNGFNGLPASVRMRTLVTNDGRMTLYHGTDEGELYDHGIDPLEQHNTFAGASSTALGSGAGVSLCKWVANAGVWFVGPQPRGSHGLPRSRAGDCGCYRLERW